MDAIQFLKEKERMCKTCGSCLLCPAWLDHECIVNARSSFAPEQQINLVKEWSAAHPSKTRQSVFMEQWPDVYLDGHRVIAMSPCTLSKEYRDIDCGLRDCAECRKEFWMKEVE